VVDNTPGADRPASGGPRLARSRVWNADNLHTIPKSLLDGRIGALSADKARALDAAIKLALSLP
jgi:mRNA-degrading endonuclease toxin of MazEF toxin-antitoxin module